MSKESTNQKVIDLNQKIKRSYDYKKTQFALVQGLFEIVQLKHELIEVDKPLIIELPDNEITRDILKPIKEYYNPEKNSRCFGYSVDQKGVIVYYKIEFVDGYDEVYADFVSNGLNYDVRSDLSNKVASRASIFIILYLLIGFFSVIATFGLNIVLALFLFINTFATVFIFSSIAFLSKK